MELNAQSSTDAQQPGAIVVDRRFGKRSDIARKNISRGVKRYMRNFPGKVSAQHAKLRDQRLGKPRTDLRGRTGPKQGTSPVTASWEIVKLRANGASLLAIAKERGMKLSGAHYRVETLDLPPGLYDCGEPFSKSHARHLWHVSGLTYGEFAKQVGVSSRSLQADLSPKRSAEYIRPDRARKYLAWRDRTVEVLLAEAPGEKGKRVRWGKSSALKTFIPNLRVMRELLVRTLPAIGSYLRDHAQTNENELGEWVCDQAQAETKRDPRKVCWRKLLPWLPKLMPTLMTNSDLLRRASTGQTASAPRLWHVALSLLASYLGVSRPTLQRALEQKTEWIEPKEMRWLILQLAASTNGAIEAAAATPPSQKRRAGRRLTERHAVFIKARELHDKLKAKYPAHKDPRASWGAVAKSIVPDEFEKDPRGAADRLRLGVDHLQQVSFHTSSEIIPL